MKIKLLLKTKEKTIFLLSKTLKYGRFFFFSTFLLTVPKICFIIQLHLNNESAKEGENMLSDRQKLILKAIIEDYVITNDRTLDEVVGEIREVYSK